MKTSKKVMVPTPKKVEYHYYLPYKESRSGGMICEGQENDPWPSHEDEEIELTVADCLYLEQCPRLYAEKFTIDKQIEVGYVVLVRYSTGSTFGRQNGAYHFEGLYTDLDEANSVVKSIEDDTYSKYCPWKGYFERLEGAEVLELSVRNKQLYSFRR